jgi:N-acetylmuramoyl-L-alanine amidase
VQPSTCLRPGDRGAAVRDLQERLLTAGYAVPVDGTFGADTGTAVREFQRRRGLLADGVCGPQTWGALVESSYRLGDRLLYHRRPMLRGDDVAELQRRLNALGFDAGREDGILGPDTERAVRAFQRDAGLASDGVCGPATVGALVRLGSLAAGSVAAVREREALRTGSQLRDRACYVIAEPGLAALADVVARRLRESGALVALDATGADASELAQEANRFGADFCLALGTGAEPGVRCAYFATERFRSEAGLWIARHLTAALGTVVDGVEPPVGRTYTVLRETRMAAVCCELAGRDDPGSVARLVQILPDLGAAIAAGAQRGIEAPLDLTT